MFLEQRGCDALKKPKLLYIEFSGSHSEVINSMLEILKEDFEFQFLLNSKLKNKIPKSISSQQLIFCDFDTMKPVCMGWKARKIIKDFAVDAVFFNTAQGKSVLWTCLFSMTDSARFFGIVHDTKKLLKSIGQKIIGLRIEKFFVLSDQLAMNLQRKSFQKNRICSVYPVYFEHNPLNEEKSLISLQSERSGTRLFAIPGEVNFKRRDYLGLIHDLRQPDSDQGQKIDGLENIRFVVLGNSEICDGPKFKKLLEDLDLLKYFIFFEGYIANETMFKLLKESLAILPLLHPGVSFFQDYFYFKISGGFNLSYGLGIPMILHREFHKLDEFRKFSVPYNSGGLVSTLKDAEQLQLRLKLAKENILICEKFKLETQSAKVRNFLFDRAF